jgi:hypothetical protein
MTYTMAKRAIRVFKDTGAKRLADEQVSNDFIWATMDVTTKLIGLVILAPLDGRHSLGQSPIVKVLPSNSKNTRLIGRTRSTRS